MKKNTEVKERIVEVTKELIMNSRGDINKITTRTIADKADVGVGLINYHYQTKDNLIEICIEDILNKVMEDIEPCLKKQMTTDEKLKQIAKIFADFFAENESVARIAIIYDMNNPSKHDSTTKTINVFKNVLNDVNMTNEEKAICTFSLISILQLLFIRRNVNDECFNVNFKEKDTRDMFIDYTVELLCKCQNKNIA